MRISPDGWNKSSRDSISIPGCLSVYAASTKNARVLSYIPGELRNGRFLRRCLSGLPETPSENIVKQIAAMPECVASVFCTEKRRKRPI